MAKLGERELQIRALRVRRATEAGRQSAAAIARDVVKAAQARKPKKTKARAI